MRDRAGRLRPLAFAAVLAALAALPFVILWRTVLRPPPEEARATTSDQPVSAAVSRSSGREVPRFQLPVAPGAHELGVLLGTLVAAGPSSPDEQQRQRARDAFAAAAGLDGEGRGALAGSVDRFVTAMDEIAVRLADPMLSRQAASSDEAVRELVDSALTAYRRAVDELEAVMPGRGASAAGPLLASQLAPPTRAALRALGR